jgi:hypothetical protein
MKASTAEIERQAQAILDGMESGMELFEERAMPWIERNRLTILAIGAGALVGVGAAIIVARRRRRPTLVARLHDATVSVGDRLERPISTLKTAAERISR